MADAFGAKGVFVETADQLERAMQEATAVLPLKPTIINCMISRTATRGKRKVALFLCSISPVAVAAAPPYAKTGKL